MKPKNLLHRMSGVSILVALSAVALGCPRGGGEEPPPVLFPPDGPCRDACSNLRQLGCPEGSPTASGQSCEAVCERSSRIRTWPLECVAKASTKLAVIACKGFRCTQ